VHVHNGRGGIRHVCPRVHNSVLEFQGEPLELPRMNGQFIVRLKGVIDVIKVQSAVHGII